MTYDIKNVFYLDTELTMPLTATTPADTSNATDPGTATADINFADSTLLAAGVIRAGTGVSQPLTVTTVFENEKFNQNIFVTLKGSGSGYNQDINYYLELKESKLSLDEQTVATLTNIRNAKMYYS